MGPPECPKCGRQMVTLFHVEHYCPACEEESPGDPWDIKGVSPDECHCPAKHNYTFAKKVWCRACGRHIRDLS